MTERTDADLPELEDEEVVEGEVVEESAETPDPASLGIELPADPDEAIALLLRELRDARDEASSYLDDLRRVAADFDNFRKRALREQAQIIERATERLIVDLLPVLDSFDAALAIEPQTETEEKVLAGMRSTHAQFLDVLAKHGLEVIPTWGESFDPEIHEAVTSPGPGEGRLVVSQELRRGYKLRGRVIRAALVAVEHERTEE